MLVDVMEVKAKNSIYKRLLGELKSSLVYLKPLIEAMSKQNKVVHLPNHEVENFISEMEKGIKLVRKCSRVRKWSNYKKYEYTDKLLRLNGYLQRLFIELKGQVEMNVKEITDSITSIEAVIKKIEEGGVVQNGEIQSEPPPPAVELDDLNVQEAKDVIKETLEPTRNIEEGVEPSEESRETFVNSSALRDSQSFRTWSLPTNGLGSFYLRLTHKHTEGKPEIWIFLDGKLVHLFRLSLPRPVYLKEDELDNEKISTSVDGLVGMDSQLNEILEDELDNEKISTSVDGLVGMDSHLNEILKDELHNEKISTFVDGLVGMDSHLNKMLSYLDIGGPDDVRIIGICGMGGIGKTTIAQVVYEMVRPQFEGNSFLENIREVIEKQSPVHLQEKLLSNLLKSNVNVPDIEMGKDIIRHRLCTKRVLIVLDDVDQDEQLEALCDRKWFGPGSRIILTSRDEYLLTAFEVDKVYKVNPLSDAEARELFHMKAFKKDQLVGDEFLKLSKEFLKYANGLPFAIKVLGSSVRGRRVNLWSSTLDRLNKNHEKKIIDVLKVSFDGLNETEKKTFLDIACFFKGWDIHRVTRILQGSDHCPDIDIEVLVEKSMVTLFGRTLWMHDLIQELGWEIVRQECRADPGKRSRLWVPKEIINVLGQSKGTSAIQSILLQGPTKDDVVHSINDSFSNMDRLRLLSILNVKFSGNIKYLSNELQYLEWLECPLNSFPSDFQPDNLVELRMPSSRIEQLWKGNKGWRMLQLIDMTGSEYLKSTPDFTEVPFLEILMLDCCTSLVEVHPSLGFLKKLKSLSMKVCISVESMPPFTSLESLEFLSLSLCLRLKKFPEIEGNMKMLLELHLDGTSIEELPPSVECLTGLTTLNLTGCKNLLHLSSTIQCLTCLKSLNLSGCSKLDEIPENLKCAESLEQLNIGGTAIQDTSFLVGMKNLKSLSCQGCEGHAPRSVLLPASLSSLTSLIDLDLSYCNLMDGDIPDDLSSLISLTVLDLSGNYFVRLPESFSQLSKLETLYLRNCRQLELVPKKLPLSLRYVLAEGCTSLTDYPNQIKVLTSVESGVTTINSLIDSSAFSGDSDSFETWTLNDEGSFDLRLIHNKHTEEQRVDSLSLPCQVHLKAVERLTLLNTLFVAGAENEIPEWFSTTSTRSIISIPIGDNKWKGVAACVLFSVNRTADAEFSNYWYQIILATDVVRVRPYVIDWEVELRPVKSSSDLLLIYYEPSFKFPEWGLNESTAVMARFETNNPYMVVHKCGIRLVYEEDAGWYFTNMFPGVDSIWLNKEEGNAVLQSGWVTLVDKYMNWEKVIPPSQEEYSTLVLRKNIESVLPRYLEALNHSTATYNFNLSGSPAWFDKVACFVHTIPQNLQGMWFPVPIEIPQNLHKSKKWMGFAIHASIAEEVGRMIAQEEEDKYRVYFKLTPGEFKSESGSKSHKTVSRQLEHVRSSEEHHQLLVVYIPRAQISEAMFTKTSPTDWHISFMIDSPHVKFRTTGARIVYQEDIQGFADTIIRCMQREDSLEFYDKMVVENWMQLIRVKGDHFEGMSNPKERDSRTRWEKKFELLSQKYRNWDWSTPIPVRCDFYGAEISKWKWFMHFKQGNSVEIQLPSNLFDDANWMGIALCAFNRFSHEDPNRSVGSTSTSPDSEYNVLTCRLHSDVDWAGLHDIIVQATFRKLEPTEFAYDSTWFVYIPCGGKYIDKRWKQCKMARATISSSRPCLAVHSCALRLVYKKDVEQIVRTLTSCDLP